MCIIVAVPRDVEMPSTETLRECFKRNPDGAGFMWADGKTVRIRKGFMTFNEFVDALNAEEIPDGSAIVMHFRIATHGKVQPSCCHPFPVSSNRDAIKATRIESRIGVAHNGVIHGTKTDDSWSDSMDFVANVIAPLSRICPGFVNNSNAEQLLEWACKSKLAIMDNSGDMMLVGDFHESNGVFYSNTSYIPVVHNWSNYGNLWNSWVDTYYEDKPWDDMDKLIEHLPYAACQLCDMAQDCAQWVPECESEDVANQACAYYSGYEETELAELVGYLDD